MALIKATIIANMAAFKNPSTANPVNHLLTNKIINTLMMKETRPKVRKLSGKVIILRINPMVALASAINMAARSAVPKLSTVTPGAMYFAPKNTARPVNKISIMNLIML